MSITANRPSRVEALEAFLNRVLVAVSAPDVRNLQGLVDRINAKLNVAHVLTPTYTKEVEHELRFDDAAWTNVGKAEYKKHSNGDPFEAAYKNALEAWLAAIYYRDNQPPITFDVVNLSVDGVTVKFTVDYLAPVVKLARPV